jgi:ADP-ribose 1''-phosphate phosphatase
MTDYFKPAQPTKTATEEATTQEQKHVKPNTADTNHNESTSKPTDTKPPTEPLKKDPTTESKAAMPLSAKKTSSRTLTLSYVKGLLWNAPPNALLIHACNTQGSWGAGIAAALRTRYPNAYKIYRAHCLETHDPKTNPVPTGTCLLIPPCETMRGKEHHWIGCVFTSANYGATKDSPDMILSNTGPAMRELLEKASVATKNGKGVGEVRMCLVNSARFAVPWEKTMEVLKGIEVQEGWARHIHVYDRDFGDWAYGQPVPNAGCRER